MYAFGRCRAVAAISMTDVSTSGLGGLAHSRVRRRGVVEVGSLVLSLFGTCAAVLLHLRRLGLALLPRQKGSSLEKSKSSALDLGGLHAKLRGESLPWETLIYEVDIIDANVEVPLGPEIQRTFGVCCWFVGTLPQNRDAG